MKMALEDPAIHYCHLLSGGDAALHSADAVYGGEYYFRSAGDYLRLLYEFTVRIPVEGAGAA